MQSENLDFLKLYILPLSVFMLHSFSNTLPFPLVEKDQRTSSTVLLAPNSILFIVISAYSQENGIEGTKNLTGCNNEGLEN